MITCLMGNDWTSGTRVKVMALDAPEPGQMRRFGFMAGQTKVPADFNTMGAAEIEALFESEA